MFLHDLCCIWSNRPPVAPFHPASFNERQHAHHKWTVINVTYLLCAANVAISSPLQHAMTMSTTTTATTRRVLRGLNCALDRQTAESLNFASCNEQFFIFSVLPLGFFLCFYVFCSWFVASPWRPGVWTYLQHGRHF